MIGDMANGVMVEGREEERTSSSRAVGFVTIHGSKVESYTEMQPMSHPVLPSNAAVTYLDEGASNIVYRLSVPPVHEELATSYRDNCHSTPHKENGSNFWQGKLLRLRKEVPWTAPCVLAQENFLQNIYPLLHNEFLIKQQLVEVESSGIIRRLNQELREWDNGYQEYHRKPRPTRGFGRYLADDNYGLLIEDMTLLKAPYFRLLEFKPKWLVQSRSALEYSKRCRTCARRARKNADRARASELLLPSFCPLDLVSNDDTALYRAARAILVINDPVSPNELDLTHRISQWARESSLPARLAHLQATLDSKGVFAADVTDSNFLTAMTLRDCSLFLQIPENDLSAPIVAKLGDLDLKRSEKAEYWKDVERKLLEEGWYLGTEKDEDKQSLDCNLFPEYWTPEHLKAALRPKRWSDPVRLMGV